MARSAASCTVPTGMPDGVAQARPWVLGAIGAAAIASLIGLDLSWSDLIPDGAGFGTAVEFASAAFTPAFAHEPDSVPAGTAPLLAIVLESVWLTIVFAVTALSLAVPSGLILGFLSSTSWWQGDLMGGRSPWVVWFRRTVAPAIYVTSRALIGVMRSIHELIWAVLFLAALGLSDLSAVFAIAIPYAGTLAKVFSEMLDEAPRGPALALRSTGASPAQVFAFGLLPRALPDMAAYTLYRFECALRSSAILGFFGWPTLGYHLKLEWGNYDFPEVWTFLYALLILVFAVDWWSGSLRKRFVA